MIISYNNWQFLSNNKQSIQLHSIYSIRNNNTIIIIIILYRGISPIIIYARYGWCDQRNLNGLNGLLYFCGTVFVIYFIFVTTTVVCNNIMSDYLYKWDCDEESLRGDSAGGKVIETGPLRGLIAHTAASSSVAEKFRSYG
jgi:hypothetical protein